MTEKIILGNFNMLNVRKPFCFEDLNLSFYDFNIAMAEMLNHGLVISFEEDGVTYYQLTDIGIAVGQHLTSDHKMAN